MNSDILVSIQGSLDSVKYNDVAKLVKDRIISDEKENSRERVILCDQIARLIDQKISSKNKKNKNRGLKGLMLFVCRVGISEYERYKDESSKSLTGALYPLRDTDAVYSCYELYDYHSRILCEQKRPWEAMVNVHAAFNMLYLCHHLNMDFFERESWGSTKKGINWVVRAICESDDPELFLRLRSREVSSIDQLTDTVKDANFISLYSSMGRDLAKELLVDILPKLTTVIHPEVGKKFSTEMKNIISRFDKKIIDFPENIVEKFVRKREKEVPQDYHNICDEEKLYRAWAKENRLFLSWFDHLYIDKKHEHWLWEDSIELNTSKKNIEDLFLDIKHTFMYSRWLHWRALYNAKLEMAPGHEHYSMRRSVDETKWWEGKMTDYGGNRLIFPDLWRYRHQCLIDSYLRLYTVIEKCAHLIGAEFYPTEKVDSFWDLLRPMSSDSKTELRSVKMIFAEIDPNVEKNKISFYINPHMWKMNIVRNHMVHRGFVISSKNIHWKEGTSNKAISYIGHDELGKLNLRLMHLVKELIVSIVLSMEKKSRK